MKRILLCLVVLFALASDLAWAQDRTITGTVTSQEDGQPLPGVNVVVKGTTNGTVTDTEGVYRLNVPQGSNTLVFTFIGLQTLETEIGGRSTVDVQMSQDVKQLSEVVVTALGLEADRDKFASATSQVAGNAVAKSGEATLINGLSGKASGVNIVRSSGDPGAGSYIQIRGQSTITGSLQPLIVLDGVPIYNSSTGNIVNGAVSNIDGVVQQSRLNDINPNDIESVEILKGASAAALWGTRAANGVIVITTKKGASDKGKVNISFNSTYSVDQVYLTHDLTKNWGSGTLMRYRQTPPSGYSWGDYIPNRSGGEDAYISDPSATGYNGFFEAPDGTRIYAIAQGTAENPHGGKNSRQTYDYRDYLFDNGNYWDNSISLSGGNPDENFYLSIGNMNQDGVIKRNSNYDRTTIRLNASKRFNEIIRLGTNFSYAGVKSDRIQMGSNTSGLYLGGLRTSPDFNSDIYVGTYTNAAGVRFLNRQRSYRNPLGANTASVYDNPVWMMRNNTSTSEVDRFIGSAELGITATKWLDITARAGVDSYSDRRTDFFNPLASQIPGGRLTLNTIRETQINGDLFGNANFNLSNDLTLNAILGLNLNHRQFDLVGATTQSFIITTQIPQDITNAAPENQLPFNSLEYQRTAALYSTLDFGFKDQLFVNLTGRAESASTFGSEVASTFFFPSASVAWQFSKLLEGNDVLSFGKVRAAWGNVGVQPSPYNTATYYALGGYAESWSPALSAGAYGPGGYTESTRLGNAELKPEIKTEIEFGTDLRFFQDRITLGLTYFTNETRDAILPVATASSTGFSDKVANAATIENKGFEVDFGADVIKANDFTWNINANWSTVRNKVVDLAGTTSLFLAGFTGSSSRAVPGEPLGVLWGVDFVRDDNGQLVLNEAGYPQAAAQESVIGDPNPDWRGGFGNTFSFKGLSLYVLFEAVWGGDIWAGTHGIMNHFGRSMETDVMTTLSANEAAATPVHPASGLPGTTVATRYPANADGTYTFRGSVTDFGGGPVALDQGWYTTNGGGFGPVSSQFIKDASNWRVREVTLSYNLTSEGFRRTTKLNSVNFALTGRNLFIDGPDIKVIGNDPETNLTGPTNGRGLEYFNNPSTRSYLFSIRINY
jgi:TonB-linked SusC/RagA family outer membrane protein